MVGFLNVFGEPLLQDWSSSSLLTSSCVIGCVTRMHVRILNSPKELTLARISCANTSDQTPEKQSFAFSDISEVGQMQLHKESVRTGHMDALGRENEGQGFLE